MSINFKKINIKITRYICISLFGHCIYTTDCLGKITINHVIYSTISYGPLHVYYIANTIFLLYYDVDR